jgi:uncharacterized Zn finger protein (UPF0148 family)
MQGSKQAKMTAAKARGGELWSGLGRCSRCSCPSFKGQGNICEYCGHHYDDHGTSPFRACESQDQRHKEMRTSSKNKKRASCTRKPIVKQVILSIHTCAT